MEFSKGRIEKEKNVIIMTPAGKDKAYKLDVNTGVLYGLRGSTIATIPSILTDGMKTAHTNKYDLESLEDNVAILLSNFYDILYYSDLSFNQLAQKGILLILDKIMNAVGAFCLNHITIKQLQYIDKNFTAYVKYMKDETIYPELSSSNKTNYFEWWYKQSLMIEKFKLNEYSECTKLVVEKLLNDQTITFSDEEIKVSIGICEHQLATFFDNDPYRISSWLTYYKQMCNDLQVPMKKGNFMMEYNAVKREYDVKKADIDKAKLQARYAKHAKAWEFEDDEYMVIIPTCADDFITEGKLQHNCVGGYVNKVMNENGGCHVIFLRKKENPEIPVLTVEINSREQMPTIKQFLLAYNQYPDSYTQPELFDLKNRLQKWICENW